MLALMMLLGSAAVSPRLMATLKAGSVPGVAEELQVLEDITTPGSPIIFKGATTQYSITKNAAEANVPVDESKLWGGRDVNDILTAKSDIMGNEILAKGGDPVYKDVEALVPPVLNQNLNYVGDFQLFAQTFIGSRLAEDKRSFSWKGEEHGLNTRQKYHFDIERFTVNNTNTGLLGGYMPAVRWYWPFDGGEYAEQIAFALPNSTEDSPFDVSSQQPIWIRYLNVSAAGELRYVHYVDTYEDYPNYCATPPRSTVPTNPGYNNVSWVPNQLSCNGGHAEQFYADLLSFALYWNATWLEEEAMEVELPTHGVDVANFAKHSVVREMITRRAKYHGRYGTPPMYYAACCDGFQDVFVAGMATYLEWGMYTTAAGVLDNYFTYYVRRGAKVMYRGPEMAQYGRMLTLAAQYYRYTGSAAGDGSTLLLKHSAKLLDISTMLLQRRRAAQLLPKNDPSFGMIRGIDESDEMFNWSKNTTELPHFSFSLEAWRGFRDLGAVWTELGAAHTLPDLVAAGAELEAEAPLIMHDVGVAMARCRLPPAAAPTTAASASAAAAAPCHPYVAGEPTCYDMTPVGAKVSGTSGKYNDRASEPWRSYNNMFWSGGLSASVATDIVAYNQHNAKLSLLGVWSGVGVFDNQFMSFTEQGHGYGLVQFGMAEEFILQLYAEMAHDCTRGSWTCFESRGLPNNIPPGGYTPPSQVVVPLHVKWMLVFVDPMDGSVALCKTTPRSWLQAGESIRVKGAPIPGKRLSFNITSHLESSSSSGSSTSSSSGAGAATISASVTATPVVAVAAMAASAPSSSNANNNNEAVVVTAGTTLTLRVPLGWLMYAVTVDGQAWTKFSAANETVTLPALTATATTVVASYKQGVSL